MTPHDDLRLDMRIIARLGTRDERLVLGSLVLPVSDPSELESTVARMVELLGQELGEVLADALTTTLVPYCAPEVAQEQIRLPDPGED